MGGSTQSKPAHAFVSSLQGLRKSMEDDHCIQEPLQNIDGWDYYAVFDGHNGSLAAHYCAKQMHVNISAFLKVAYKTFYKNNPQLMQTGSTTPSRPSRSSVHGPKTAPLSPIGEVSPHQTPVVSASGATRHADASNTSFPFSTSAASTSAISSQSTPPLDATDSPSSLPSPLLFQALKCAFVRTDAALLGYLDSDDDDDEKDENGEDDDDNDGEDADAARRKKEERDERRKHRKARLRYRASHSSTTTPGKAPSGNTSTIPGNISSSSMSATDVPLVLEDADAVLDDELSTRERREASTAGTTALVVLIHRASGRVIIAHAGDSRCVWLRRDGTAKQLTVDHKPDAPLEQHRILAAGHTVTHGRLNEVLGVSRSIGLAAWKHQESQLPLHKRALTPVPDVKEVLVKPPLWVQARNAHVYVKEERKVKPLSLHRSYSGADHPPASSGLSLGLRHAQSTPTLSTLTPTQTHTPSASPVPAASPMPAHAPSPAPLPAAALSLAHTHAHPPLPPRARIPCNLDLVPPPSMLQLRSLHALLLACDGLWDVVGCQEAADYVNWRFRVHVRACAYAVRTYLAKHGISPTTVPADIWLCLQLGPHPDDICCHTTDFKRFMQGETSREMERAKIRAENAAAGIHICTPPPRMKKREEGGTNTGASGAGVGMGMGGQSLLGQRNGVTRATATTTNVNANANAAATGAGGHDSSNGGSVAGSDAPFVMDGETNELISHANTDAASGTGAGHESPSHFFPSTPPSPHAHAPQLRLGNVGVHDVHPYSDVYDANVTLVGAAGEKMRQLIANSGARASASGVGGDSNAATTATAAGNTNTGTNNGGNGSAGASATITTAGGTGLVNPVYNVPPKKDDKKEKKSKLSLMNLFRRHSDKDKDATRTSDTIATATASTTTTSGVAGAGTGANASSLNAVASIPVDADTPLPTPSLAPSMSAASSGSGPLSTQTHTHTHLHVDTTVCSPAAALNCPIVRSCLKPLSPEIGPSTTPGGNTPGVTTDTRARNPSVGNSDPFLALPEFFHLESLSQAMTQRALDRGSRDNVTVMLVLLDPVPSMHRAAVKAFAKERLQVARNMLAQRKSEKAALGKGVHLTRTNSNSNPVHTQPHAQTPASTQAQGQQTHVPVIGIVGARGSGSGIIGLNLQAHAPPHPPLPTPHTTATASNSSTTGTGTSMGDYTGIGSDGSVSHSTPFGLGVGSMDISLAAAHTHAYIYAPPKAITEAYRYGGRGCATVVDDGNDAGAVVAYQSAAQHTLKRVERRGEEEEVEGVGEKSVSVDASGHPLPPAQTQTQAQASTQGQVQSQALTQILIQTPSKVKTQGHVNGQGTSGTGKIQEKIPGRDTSGKDLHITPVFEPEEDTVIPIPLALPFSFRSPTPPLPEDGTLRVPPSPSTFSTTSGSIMSATSTGAGIHRAVTPSTGVHVPAGAGAGMTRLSRNLSQQNTSAQHPHPHQHQQQHQQQHILSLPGTAMTPTVWPPQAMQASTHLHPHSQPLPHTLHPASTPASIRTHSPSPYSSLNSASAARYAEEVRAMRMQQNLQYTQGQVGGGTMRKAPSAQSLLSVHSRAPTPPPPHLTTPLQQQQLQQHQQQQQHHMQFFPPAPTPTLVAPESNSNPQHPQHGSLRARGDGSRGDGGRGSAVRSASNQSTRGTTATATGSVSQPLPHAHSHSQQQHHLLTPQTHYHHQQQQGEFPTPMVSISGDAVSDSTVSSQPMMYMPVGYPYTQYVYPQQIQSPYLSQGQQYVMPVQMQVPQGYAYSAAGASPANTQQQLPYNASVGAASVSSTGSGAHTHPQPTYAASVASSNGTHSQGGVGGAGVSPATAYPQMMYYYVPQQQYMQVPQQVVQMSPQPQQYLSQQQQQQQQQQQPRSRR